MIRLPVAALLLTATPALHAAQPIAGRWITEDGVAVVAVAPCGKALCGRIATILKRTPGKPLNDVNNADPALRARPILGMPVLTGFTDAGKDWRGQIYDPRSGKTYRSVVKRAAGGTLEVKGCVAVFCRTQTWRPTS